MLGKRLKLARAAAGLSLRDLQVKIGNRVTAQAIGKYEREEDVPGSGVLIALADALSVPLDYLVGGPDILLHGVEFRKKPAASKREEAQVQATTLYRVERYLTVEDILGLPSTNTDLPRESPYPVRELADAERAALCLRAYWNLGADPIPQLVELLEDRGTKVIPIDRQLNIGGLAGQVRRRNHKPVRVIVIATGMHGEHQRFHLARELGHIVLDAGSDEIFREKAAHRFAGSFLMPAEALWGNAGRHRTSMSWGELFGLKKLFGASVQEIAYRCGGLDILPPALVQRLLREYSRLGYANPPQYEPGNLPEEQPERFRRLCYRALTEEAISEPKAAELLNLTIRELNQRMEDPAAAA